MQLLTQEQETFLNIQKTIQREVLKRRKTINEP